MSAGLASVSECVVVDCKCTWSELWAGDDAFVRASADVLCSC